ncbi:MAG: hypothetical protein RL199_1416 [Pseudomonadota bacterium]|jgi:undecaprenyl diphosphate synthase
MTASDLARLEEEVRSRPLPRHLALIMDGNGRWAEAQGLGRVEGHRAGSESVREVTRCARRLGLEALTLYAFSTQNWGRPVGEVFALMDLLRAFLEDERAEILENDIRLNAIGDLDRLPGHVRKPLDRLCAESDGNRGMVLTLALSYGGREDLVQAVRELVGRAQRGALDARDVDERLLDEALWTRGLPPVDLMVRTSGEQRISNFVLWPLAYAELAFVDLAWPEFRTAALLGCLADWQRRERRFGLTGAQVQHPAGAASPGVR